jgi:hypothetical protein
MFVVRGSWFPIKIGKAETNWVLRDDGTAIRRWYGGNDRGG